MSKRYFVAALGLLFASFFVQAQSTSDGQRIAPAGRADSDRSVPHLVRFSGSLKKPTSTPGHVVGATFALYKDHTGGAPLWLETQNVSLDESGRYNVLLGATHKDGLPLELFANNEARWLGIRIQGEEEQERILLLSVPYALKAADAETLGGRPASDFAMNVKSDEDPDHVDHSALKGSGTKDFVAKFTASSTLGNSLIFDSGINIGIGTTAPSAKLHVVGDIISSGTVTAFGFSGIGSALTQVNAATLNGFSSGAFARLAASNTFTANQTVIGNVNIYGAGNGIVFPDGSKQITASSGGGNGIPAGFMILGNSPNPPPGFTFTGALTTSDTWSDVSAMPTPRSNLAAAELNGKIYAIGGNGLHSTLSAPLNTVEVFDPVANIWTTSMSMPTARYDLAVAAVNGKIYAIGGINGGLILNQVEVYDPVANTWSTAIPMPTARFGMSAAAVNGKIYVFGGYVFGSITSIVEVYDPAANTWSTAMPMPTARSNLEAVALNGKIYAIGGYIESSGAQNTVEVYDPVSNSWSTAAPLPTRRNNFAATALNGKIYAIGGQTPSGPLNIVEVYDPSVNSWGPAGRLPSDRGLLAASVAGGQMFVLGGYTDSSVLRYVFGSTLYTFTKN